MKKRNITLVLFIIILFIFLIFLINYIILKPQRKVLAKIEGYISDFFINDNNDIILSGSFSKFNKIKIDKSNRNIIKININGKIDKTFVQNNLFNEKINLFIQKIFPLDDEKFIVIYNYEENLVLKTAIAKFDSKMNKISEFISNSFIVNAIDKQDDGKILIAGKIYDIDDFYPFHILRLNEDLTIDKSFDTSYGFNKQIYDIIYKDSMIYIAGEFSNYKGVDSGRIVRLNLNGELDQNFNTQKGANSDIFDIDIDEKGNILIAGMFKYFNDTERIAVARLKNDGSIDLKYNPVKSIKSLQEESGDYTFTNNLEFLPQINKIVYDNGKVIIAGNFSNINDIPAYKIARITKNGKIDKSFKISIIDIIKKSIKKNDQTLQNLIKSANINKIILLEKNTYLISIVYPSNSLLVKIKLKF
ncbi:MAG: delta-60 repeat domain-containing protein [Exilispira sp.]